MNVRDSIPRIHHRLETPLVHPPITHHKPALLARLLAPTILHPPPDTLPLDHMHCRQHHRVRHGALPGHQPLLLAHAELDVEAELVVDQRAVHDARVGVAGLADVAAEEDGQVGGQHGDAGALDGRHVDVHVRDAAPTDDVTEPADRQEAHVLVPGVVDQAEQLVHVRAHVCGNAFRRGELGGKFHWCGGHGVELVVLVAEVPGEFFVGVGWRPKHEGLDTVDVT